MREEESAGESWMELDAHVAVWRVATRKSSVPRVAGCGGGGGAEVHGRRIWRVGHRLVPGGPVVSVGRAVVTGGQKGARAAVNADFDF
jgi:hypothetical protein